MIYYVKNKMVSIGDGSFVTDENGKEHFKIQGKWLSPTRKKFIFDAEGNQIFTVRNKFWHFMTKKALIYNADGEKICKVKERFFGLGFNFDDCEDDLSVDIEWGKGMLITKNGKEIGRYTWGVQNALDIFRDCFKLEVFDESETNFLVALVIAIDNIRDQKKDK